VLVTVTDAVTNAVTAVADQ